jgi:predicted AAA+ superfamily ATPase
LGLSLDQLCVTDEIDFVNKRGIAEQVVGQILRTIVPFYVEPALYYWHREQKGSNAEIDYVIQHRNQVIPVEVKAGSTGSLKSLHLFMGLKKFTTAVRINSDMPTKTEVDIKNHQGESVQYTLFSIPFYLLSRLHQLLP